MRTDFEPGNGRILKRKMFPNRGMGMERRIKFKKIRKPEPMYRAEGDTQETEIRPVDTDKKIFGMKPKTIIMTAAVIIIAIAVINYSKRGDANVGLEQ